MEKSLFPSKSFNRIRNSFPQSFALPSIRQSEICTQNAPCSRADMQRGWGVKLLRRKICETKPKFINYSSSIFMSDAFQPRLLPPLFAVWLTGDLVSLHRRTARAYVVKRDIWQVNRARTVIRNLKVAMIPSNSTQTKLQLKFSAKASSVQLRALLQLLMQK